MRSPLPSRISFGLFSLMCVSAAMAQGPAPETAPPLFPGGGLISYNSVFTTRQPTGSSGSIPATARPTFSHEATGNFTWGFHRDFDLTVLVPIVTNEFKGASRTGAQTGVGDAMLLVKYRFFAGTPRGEPRRHRSP